MTTRCLPLYSAWPPPTPASGRGWCQGTVGAENRPGHKFDRVEGLSQVVTARMEYLQEVDNEEVKDQLSAHCMTMSLSVANH